MIASVLGMRKKKPDILPALQNSIVPSGVYHLYVRFRMYFKGRDAFLAFPHNMSFQTGRRDSMDSDAENNALVFSSITMFTPR